MVTHALQQCWTLWFNVFVPLRNPVLPSELFVLFLSPRGFEGLDRLGDQKTRGLGHIQRPECAT